MIARLVARFSIVNSKAMSPLPWSAFRLSKRMKNMSDESYFNVTTLHKMHRSPTEHFTVYDSPFVKGGCGVSLPIAALRQRDRFLSRPGIRESLSLELA